jgi:hypothetical protein
MHMRLYLTTDINQPNVATFSSCSIHKAYENVL